MGEFRELGAPPKGDAGDGHRNLVHVDADVLADLGHQLRNQLNAVVGAAGLLSTGAETSEERELAAIVEAGAEQVARIIDEWLDSATIESGEFELALHPFDVRSMVESCLGLVSEAAGAKSLDISFNAAPGVPKVVIGDSRRLEQILLTLLHSAVDRTNRGGIGVELSSDDRGGLVALQFKIRDTGRGVPARILRGALDGVTGPYDKLEPGDRLAVLSLRTTKQLIELMDGELRVEQWGANATSATPEDALGAIQMGRPFDIALIEHRAPAIDGLEFSASLRAVRRAEQMPIVLISSMTPGPAEAEAADSGVIQATLTKPVPPRTLHDVMIQVGGRGAQPHSTQEVVPGALRVLIADDNALNQNLLKRLVSKLGHSVDVVSNGREAVAAVAQQPYDALLMDVLMPEMDGLVAAEAICRRWPRGNRPRLIALTAMAGPGDQERCLRAGFDDYMSKPIRLEDLTESLKAAVGYRTNRESAGL